MDHLNAGYLSARRGRDRGGVGCVGEQNVGPPFGEEAGKGPGGPGYVPGPPQFSVRKKDPNRDPRILLLPEPPLVPEDRHETFVPCGRNRGGQIEKDPFRSSPGERLD
jgi:hypothetical protein